MTAWLDTEGYSLTLQIGGKRWARRDRDGPSGTLEEHPWPLEAPLAGHMSRNPWPLASRANDATMSNSHVLNYC